MPMQRQCASSNVLEIRKQRREVLHTNLAAQAGNISLGLSSAVCEHLLFIFFLVNYLEMGRKYPEPRKHVESFLIIYSIILLGIKPHLSKYLPIRSLHQGRGLPLEFIET